MHSRQYISNVEGPPKFCIDLEADWLLILGEVGGKSPGMAIMKHICLRTYYVWNAMNAISFKCSLEIYMEQCVQ